MIVDINLNIVDVVSIVREAMGKKLGCEVRGITVLSWNTVVLQVEDDTLTTPVRHHLRPEHSEL